MASQAKCEYQYDKEQQILHKKYFGQITIEDITASWDTVIAGNLIPEETKGFVLDYLEADITINLEEYMKIPLYYQGNLTVFGGKKIAIVTVKPRDVVIPILVEKHDNGYRSRAFSTLSAATEWVAL